MLHNKVLHNKFIYKVIVPKNSRMQRIENRSYFSLLYITFLLICLSTVKAKAFDTVFFADITVDSSYVDNDTFSDDLTRGLINIGLETELAQLTRLTGKEILFTASYAIQRGDNGSEIAGDIQGFSNIDSEDFNRFFDVFLAMKLSEKSLVKFGQMDANTDFAFTEYGSEFINSSMGVSPTIQGLPTYPQPTVGIYAEYTFNSLITTRFGSYESSATHNKFDDFFSIAELQWGYQNNSAVKLGVWHHSGVVKDELASQSTSDVYIVIDHYLNERFSVFMQWGAADPSLAEIKQHFSFGINFQGGFVAKDTIGFGFTLADVVEAGSEQVIELFYLYPVNDNIVIKPDLQLISSPSGDKTQDDVIALTLRFIAEF